MQWGKKLGYIVPASNAVFEFEVQRMLPPGVSAHFARAPHHPDRATRLAQMIDCIPALSRDLMAADMDAVCFGCTTGSFSAPDFESRALAGMAAAGSRVSTTTSTAVLAALAALGAKRISVVTPYPDAYNRLLVEYLEVRGVDVLDLSSLYSEEAETIPPEEVGEFALRHAHAGSDAVFISCTKLRTLEIIERVETRLGIPAISSIGASQWHVLALAGLAPATSAGPGALFRSPPAADRLLRAAGGQPRSIKPVLQPVLFGGEA